MNLIGGITMLALVLLFIFIGPVFSIMAINALFGVGIDLTLGTWFAMAWVHLVLSGAKVSKS